MNKYHAIKIAIFLASLCAMTFLYWKTDFATAFAFGFIIAFSAFGIIFWVNDQAYSQKSFINPFTLSSNDAGRTFSVERISDEKIGLMIYSPDSDEGFLIKNGRISYYWIKDFHTDVRNIGIVFKVINSSGSGLSLSIRKGVSNTLRIPREE